MRGSYRIGQSIILRVVFTDSQGEFINADSLPVVYLYDSSVDEEVMAAEVEAETFSSAIEVLTPTLLSTGYYSVSYTVDLAEGLVYEYWHAEIDGASQTTQFTWLSTAGAIVIDQTPDNNRMVLIEINGITDADDNVLVEDLFYYTKLDPLYASPELIRLELGPWIDFISDSTLVLMIHLASKRADFITVGTPCSMSRLEQARTQYVIYEAAMRALMIPGAGQSTGVADNASKTLGSLSIKTGSSTTTADASILAELNRLRNEWLRVLNSDGCLNPGQGFAPVTGLKSMYDPDRRNQGRLWEDPREFIYDLPLVNEKRRRGWRRRSRFGYYPVENYDMYSYSPNLKERLV